MKVNIMANASIAEVNRRAVQLTDLDVKTTNGQYKQFKGE